MKKLLLSVSILAAISACGKREAEPTIDFGPNTGITQRDDSNQPYGTLDPTDWTADETWTKQEQKLFTVPVDLSVPSPRSIQPRGLFPNPITSKRHGAFGFYGIPFGAMWQMVFVDKNYKVVERLEYGPFQVSDVLFGFEFPADKFTPNTIYRMYYILYTKSPATLHLKGHGDIQISM
ncbi:hypothetical protein SAMN06265337_2904 [Hymenobacter gelipurpurascens]|uniref:Lipoprotein n=1 Tax=Hymenobacter gelipurpurascens TaxID=89968 RepID=A0A212UB36_9BACT|nr:hypothetical protein [Hymenobacter gelipurpurascens]SNC75498.1 hypothetical protein SAMN06265337_2904 [Hymenobacter gelipurpurascens]